MSVETVARIEGTRRSEILSAYGQCKYPYARLGEGKVHRTTGVVLRFRRPPGLEPVTVALDCRLGWSADNPRLRLLTDDDLPRDVREFCVRCFGVRCTRIEVPA